MSSTSMDRAAPQATVTEVALPPDARAVSTLSRIDYQDAFRVESAVERTAEHWARAVLEDAPLTVRTRLISSWTALGLKLGTPRSADHVLGWRIERSEPGLVLLVAGGRLGLEGQLLFCSDARELLFATFVHHGNAAARAVWARIEHQHRVVVRSLLTEAARRSEQAAAARDA
jgi:hypothetical protein